MSFALDANILLYASDASSVFHDKARNFIATCASGSEVMCLTWPTIMAYLRIATHPSIFDLPLGVHDAMANVEALISLPHVRLLSESDGFWPAYRDATRGLAVRGNLVPDAHVATILRQHGVKTIYTNDADYRRFEFLSVKNPLR